MRSEFLSERQFEYPKIKRRFERDQCWGISTHVDLFNCRAEWIASREYIRGYVSELIELIDMKAYGEPMIERFGVDARVAGISLVQLIETSAIQGHFAEADNSAYIDIFSCKVYDPQVVTNFSKFYFDAKDADMSVIFRGAK